ncbi:piggyBac transposable element-derived protein 4-like [Eriocheir sinensis]|uniref:piggyBac transposable element-derived protein 4-like n=1 Tax=Eriocheir sinensis TaxID=95602 RepID=UPI0021C5818E|nr:piggyBac transposable element-derived protein 4-like [Eriocheir sinensis]
MEEQHHVCPLDFKPTNPGIQVDIPDEFDELAALMLFVPDDFWDTIATESNRYYRQKKKAAVKPDITPAEARTYIGIMILLGLSPPHSLRTPWKCDSTFRNDVISSCMTYSRFNHIHSNFHLVDNSTLPPKDTIAYKTARIAPLLHTLKDRCLSVYKAKTHQLSVDEGSMGWKGNSSMRQYNPNKPHKYHIKSYKLVETSTGYLSNIILHDTTSRTVDEVVLTLLDESPYNKHEGYAVFTDRFYTSPDLFWHLRTVDGYDATGICMSNRHQFPPELKCAKGKSKKGRSSYIATHGDDNLVAMRWRDAKDVFMLSTEETADLIECDSQRSFEENEYINVYAIQ